MTRTLNRLSARAVATLSTPGRHADGGGLYLFISGDGRRRWIYRFTLQQKIREMGIGSASRAGVSLQEARGRAAAARELVALGQNPLEVRRIAVLETEAKVTFGAMADEHIERMRPAWRNAKHAAQWTMTLTKYAAPLREKAVEDVDTEDVLAVLQPLWQSRPETASRVRGRIESVLDAAKARGLRGGQNPAQWRGHLDQLLPRRQKLTRGHHAALPYDQLPAFVADLQLRQAPSARLLEFVILTACRAGEALGARWGEFDLEKAFWTVPAQRMKAGKPHRVPLSGRALQLLLAQRDSAGQNADLVFLGPRGGAMSNMAMAQLLKRIGRGDITVHGFRSSFRDWAAEATDFSHEVCEMALAHVISNKAEAAYRRGDLFAKRRELMEAWSAYCLGSVRPSDPIGDGNV